jgi:hypothetical protein
VIGKGHRFHAELGDPLQQISDPDRAVEQAVLGVDVEMDKFRRVYCLHGVLTAFMSLKKKVTGRVTGLWFWIKVLCRLWQQATTLVEEETFSFGEKFQMTKIQN